MNNSLSPTKKYISCRLIEHGMMFYHFNIVRVCCIENKEYGGKPIIFNNYNGEVFDLDKFFEINHKYREMMKNGTPPKECIDCNSLEEDFWDDEDYIDNILFAHWVDCNSKCIYCLASTDEFLKKNNKHYDIYPAIKDLVEKGVIVKHAKIDFAGGEPTVYPEFENILKLFVDNNYTNICINTSAIKYSKAIEQALLTGNISLTVSIDAGTRTLHEQIKRVKSYDKVWANISDYVKSQSKSTNNKQICLKYLVVPGINDDIKEFDIFLHKVISVNVKKVALSLDMFWYEEHKKDDNSILNEKFNYFNDKAIELGLDVENYPWVNWSLEFNH